MLNDAMDKVYLVFHFVCVTINHLSHSVCACQRMEIIVWLGLSKRENKRNGAPAHVCNTGGMNVVFMKTLVHSNQPIAGLGGNRIQPCWEIRSSKCC